MNLRACLAILLLASSVFAQQLAPAPKAHVVDITPKPGYFNEPSIAVNPKNPQQIAVAWQINASVATSEDGGRTWKIAENTAPREYRVSGDVSITYDAAGRAVLCYIAFDKLGTSQYWAQGATRNGIFVRRSADAGHTWPTVAAPVISHESTPKIPFEDKPYIVAATAGPHTGDLYVGWTQFTLSTTELLFSRSSDGGATWLKPIKLSSVPGLPRDDNGALEGFDGVVAPDGTIYTIWDDRDGIMMAVSHDGGASFSKERRILKTGPGFFGITGVSRSNGFPQIWSAPARVNNDPIHNGVDQFFQWMAVDPVSGAVNLVFYDRRTDNKQTTVTLARSTDHGSTFKNYAWDQEAFAAEGDFLGDYLALAAYGDKVFGAWAHQTSEEAKTERGRKTRTVLRVGAADFN